MDDTIVLSPASIELARNDDHAPTITVVEVRLGSRAIMTRMELALLKSKFRGSMLGALVGDCLGSPYEGEESLSPGMKIVLQQALDKLEGTKFRGLESEVRALFAFFFQFFFARIIAVSRGKSSAYVINF